MKVSIITATYNAAKTLQSTIDSIAEQSYRNIEYIVIDGDSKDNTKQIIADNKRYISQHISEPDKGIYDALNKGLNKATGDIIGFLHADDIFKSEDTIQAIVSLFENTKSDGVYGDLEYVATDNTNKVIRYWKSKAFKYKMLKAGWMPAHPTLFLRKEVYKTYGNFDTRFKIAADYDFILRVFKNKTLNFSYLPNVITKMRLGGASNKSLTNIITKSREDIQALRNNKIGGFHTIIWKNLSKLPQFIKR